MKIIFMDVDGVITDGRVTIDINGNETKSICYRDLDAIGIGRHAGYDFAFVTGEDTDMVKFLAKRFFINIVYAGAKDKLKAMQNIAKEHDVPMSSLIYIGDGDRDVPALEKVGLGIVPSDATSDAKNASDIITEARGGYGVLFEVVNKLIKGELKHPGD